MDDSCGPLENFHNYLRFTVLLNNYGGIALREIFRRRYKELTGTEWNDGSPASKEFPKKLPKLLKNAKLPQKQMLKSGELSEWDVALLTSVLPKMTDAIQNNVLDYTAENKIIGELLKVRNNIEHLHGKTISLKTFNSWWKTAAEILAHLGVSTQIIEHVKNCKDIQGIEFPRKNGTGSDLDVDNVDTSKNVGNNERAKKLRENGNSVARSLQFDKAVYFYTQALNLYGISKFEKGMIYSSRSYIYMKLLEVRGASMPKDEVTENCNLALEDAKAAIELRPTWFKGYYRLGSIHQFQKEYESAITAFEQALGLNMGDKDIRQARDECRFEFMTESCLDRLHPEYIESHRNNNKEEGSSEKMRSERGAVGKITPVRSDENKNLLKTGTPQQKAHVLINEAHHHRRGTDGFTQDYRMALRLYTQASEIDRGNAMALCNLGMMHQSGLGVPRNFDLAVNYFERAAESECPEDEDVLCNNQIGVSDAQYLIGKCYQKGYGKEVSYNEAVKWYFLASENGSDMAACNLGGMYFSGLGVKKSSLRAIQFFKLSANRGAPVALENLTKAYLSLGNWNLAKLYYSFAVESGNIGASLRKDEFDETHAFMRMNQESVSSDSEEEDDSDTLEKANEQNNWSLPSEILQKAAQGFLHAQQCQTASESVISGMKIYGAIESMKKESCRPSSKLKNQLLKDFADYYRNTEILERDEEQFPEMLKEFAVETMLANIGETVGVDCDARVCYSTIISSNSPQETVNFLETFKKKYPDERYFPTLQCSLLGFVLEQDDDALRVIDEALHFFPDDVELLQKKAKILFLKHGLNRDHIGDIEKAFWDFLKVSPKDHRHVPNAYYCLGVLSLAEKELHLSSAEKFLQLGAKSEKYLLSVYLPYESLHKKDLKRMVNSLRSNLASEKDGDPNSSQNGNSSQAGVNPNPDSKSKSTRKGAREEEVRLSLIRSNPNRVDAVFNLHKIIRKKRAMTKEARNKKSKFLNRTKSKDAESIQSQLADGGLKAITLEEMNPIKDHVYSGYVLQHLKIIEDSVFDVFNSVNTVIKDEKGDVLRLSLSNRRIDSKNAEERKKYSFGSKISILNPHHRLNFNGETGIRVDDLQNVVFHSAGDDEPLCRFCWAKNPQKECVHCKRFKYCSEECKQQDWELLKHKNMCEH